eukprot:12349219-Karenia_brevis.AAC.1
MQQIAAIDKGIARREGEIEHYQEQMRRIQWKICREQGKIAELTYERMRLQEAAGEELHASWCA